MKFYIRVQGTTSYKYIKSGFWSCLGDLVKLGPNMGVATPRAPVGGRGPEPPKSSVTGPSLYLSAGKPQFGFLRWI